VFSLDLPADIEAARKATFAKRVRWSHIGFALMLGIALAVASVFYGFSVAPGIR